MAAMLIHSSRREPAPRPARQSILTAAALLLACSWAAVLPATAADRVSVAAASDLVFCLDDLAHAFTNRHPTVKVQITSGSSGNFFAQIQRGGPFDIFLSADMDYARALVTNRLAVASTLTPYAIGRIVLWTTRTNFSLESGLETLTNAGIRRIALANPDHAPYGRAAREALQSAGIWETLRSKIVLGDNISQAAQFVESGNADVGLVALSLVSAPRLKEIGRWWLIPESAHRELEQCMVLTSRGQTNPAARLFLDYLISPDARAVFERFGFRLPPAKDRRP